MIWREIALYLLAVTVQVLILWHLGARIRKILRRERPRDVRQYVRELESRLGKVEDH